MEKQRDKAAQRLQRKQTKLERGPDESPYEIGEPISLDDDPLAIDNDAIDNDAVDNDAVDVEDKPEAVSDSTGR